MKAVIGALCVLLLAILQTSEPPSLQIRLDSSKLEFQVGEPIDWTVTLTNVSRSPLRVIKPDWYFAGNSTPAPAAAFVIERDNGPIARPTRDNGQVARPMAAACISDGIGDTAEKVSVILAPAAKLVTKVSMLECWSYTFGSEPINVTAAFLRPPLFPAGRYRVSAKYGFPPGTYSRRWWAFLGSRTPDNGANDPPPLHVEEPWHGEVMSNTVGIVVK